MRPSLQVDAAPVAVGGGYIRARKGATLFDRIVDHLIIGVVFVCAPTRGGAQVGSLLNPADGREGSPVVAGKAVGDGPCGRGEQWLGGGGHRRRRCRRHRV